MKLAELLKMSIPKPSHGYTISETGPEIVTAPGIYFPSQEGEVIPLQSRAEGGSVSPTSPSSDTEKEKLAILRDIISVIKPRQGMESRQFGGTVSPDSEPSLMDQIEKTKYDIFKSAMSVLKPQPQKSYNERTSAYGSPPGKSQFSNSPSLPTTPSLPSLPGLPKPITSTSYGIMPEATKPSEGEALWQKKRAEQGWENPGEDLWTHKRREAGVLDLTSRQYGGFVSPDLEELNKRKQWEIPGYSERRLEEARNILGPSVLGIQPGFQESYYEAHPEERLMDEETYRMKPLTDAIMKSIEDERNRQQGYGVGFGPTPRELRAGVTHRGTPSQIPELIQGLKGLTPALITGGRRGILPAGVTTSRQPTLSSVGQLMTERDTLPLGDPRRITYDAAIKKSTEQVEKTEPAIEDQRKWIEIDSRMKMNKPVSEEEKAFHVSHKEYKTLGVQTRIEEEEKNLLSNEDAKWIAGKLGGKPAGMVPSQLRNFIGFGSVGQKNLSKVVKNLRKDYPEYNFALAELAYTGDKTEINRNKSLQGTVLSFEKTAIQNAKQVDALSRQIDVSKIPILNNLILKGEVLVGGTPVEAQYIASWRTIINEYARIATSVSGGGITSDAARKEIEEVLRKSYTPEQTQSVIRQLVLEMEHRRYGFEKSLYDVMSNWGEKPEFEPKLPTAEDIENIFKGKTPLVGAAGEGGERPALSSFER